MNFLDNNWLILLFPLFGAAMMLLFGKKLDPQPASEVAVAPGVEHVHDEHHHHGQPLKALIKFFFPGMVLLSFIFSLGAILELAGKEEKVHQVIQFTWLA